MNELTDSQILDLLNEWRADSRTYSDFQLVGNSVGFSIGGEFNPSTRTVDIRATVQEYYRIKQRKNTP